MRLTMDMVVIPDLEQTIRQECPVCGDVLGNPPSVNDHFQTHQPANGTPYGICCHCGHSVEPAAQTRAYKIRWGKCYRRTKRKRP